MADGSGVGVCSFIVLHVGDFLCASDATDWNLLAHALRQLELGEVFCLSESASVDFLGMEIITNVNKGIGLHMNGFVGKMEEVKITDDGATGGWWATLGCAVALPHWF